MSDCFRRVTPPKQSDYYFRPLSSIAGAAVVFIKNEIINIAHLFTSAKTKYNPVYA